jgi:DNA polymerase-3 subunit alpha
MPASKNDTHKFVHLHLHTEYSLLDGGNTVPRLVDQVAALGMDAVAVTDHGNLHAAIEFHDYARKKGIKPILGIDAYGWRVSSRPARRESRGLEESSPSFF